MAGCLHIYCGDGKGKTTAAVGLAIRCAGCGGKVLFISFLKDNTSGERKILEKLENVKLIENTDKVSFFGCMSDYEKEEYINFCNNALSYIEREMYKYQLLVLDEAIPAVNNGLIPISSLLALIEGRPKELEIVLTGRQPKDEFLEMADYITEMKKLRHPFDRGLEARRFIEM
ncbi:Cob(I)yrinic acid a,c-diamide adenosyltransferase [Clostridiales bacterium]|nr:Cob(I)yrinic acid a,c-diamide adenosyltransferase [Clostridiales bacterium]